MKSIFEHGRFGRGLAWVLVAVLWCGGAFTGYTRAQQQQPPQGQTQKKAPAKPGQPEQDEVTLAQDEEIERVNTDLTAVLFTAVDKNKRFVTTLKQEDVRVLEDGVPQPIFTFQRETERPLSLAILIDTSQSQERTLPDEKNAAREFVDAIIRPSKDEVAVISFTGDSTLEQGMTGSLQRIRRAIDHVDFVRPSGYVGGGVIVGTPPISGTNQQLAASTAIWDAVMATSTDVFQETSDKTRRAMILITDGVDTSSQYGRMNDAINAAVKADAVIYSVGIGDAYLYGVEEASLRKLSERTGGRAYFPKSEEDLRAAFAQIQQELRSQYLIAYSPTNKARDGQFRQVRIEINNPELRKENLRLTYRQGYFAKGGGGEAHTGTQKNKRP
ncbi:MAG TPA: VWA domain-containing protein [Pyrinomonadaceae bacterium]|nr:VWA domain-containing protein [Pyrinomonadaceae bacterium]